VEQSQEIKLNKRNLLNRPTGLQSALIAGMTKTPARFFICDDSGSMMSNDGHRVIQGTTPKLVSCTRWSELTETLKFHVGLAQIAGAPTEFRLLNGAAPINIGQSAATDEVAVPTMMNLLGGSPG
jgi:hypothetical protein